MQLLAGVAIVVKQPVEVISHLELYFSPYSQKQGAPNSKWLTSIIPKAIKA